MVALQPACDVVPCCCDHGILALEVLDDLVACRLLFGPEDALVSIQIKGEQQQIQKIALHLSSSRRMESNEWTYLLGRIGTAALNKLDPPLEIVLLLFSLVELL